MPAAAKLRWKKVSEASSELATGASQSLDEVEGVEEEEDEAAAATAASARSPIADAIPPGLPLPLLDTADRSGLASKCCSASAAAWACERASYVGKAAAATMGRRDVVEFFFSGMMFARRDGARGEELRFLLLE